MNDRLGSHWRWRVAMLLLAVGLIGYGWWQAGRWERRVLVESGGWPAIYRTVHHDDSYSIGAFDWRNGRHWTITKCEAEGFSNAVEESLQVSPKGDAIVWMHRWKDRLELHMADVQQPYHRRSYKLPQLPPESMLVGVSGDRRFAIFQTAGWYSPSLVERIRSMRRVWWASMPPLSIQLNVVDLGSGDIVSTRQWQSIAIETDKEDEFESFSLAEFPKDPTESHFARWKLSETGELELVEQGPQPFFRPAQVAKSPRGEWRFVDEDNPAALEDVLYPGVVSETFPELKRVCIHFGDWGPFHVMNPETKQLWTINRDEVSGLSVVKNDGVIIIGDPYDDLVVFDVRTGKVIARETSGSGRRIQLVAVAIALLLVACIWTRVGLAESMLAWGMFDALAVSLLIQLPVYALQSAWELPFLKTPFILACRAVDPADVLKGGMVGAAILGGWYLAHGRQWIAVRWLLGTLWMTVFAVPLLVSARGGIFSDPVTTFRTSLIVGLIVSSVAAAVAAGHRPFGWTICAPGEQPDTWRFGIMPMFGVVSIVAVAIVLFQSLPLFNDADFLAWSMGSVVFGIPFVGVLFLKSRWRRAFGIVALLAATGLVVCWRAEASGNGGSLPFFLGETIATAFSALTIAIPCLVLRSHGWAWTRPQPAARPQEQRINLTGAAA